MSDVRPLPVACTLTGPDLEARRGELFPSLAPHVVERRDISGDGFEGVALRFAPSAARLAAIAAVIDAERRCCRFLHFRLSVEPDEGPLWLELTGPEGTRDFLGATLAPAG
jgi:hypothetical protein